MDSSWRGLDCIDHKHIEHDSIDQKHIEHDNIDQKHIGQARSQAHRAEARPGQITST